jgi:hypothetical protein
MLGDALAPHAQENHIGATKPIEQFVGILLCRHVYSTAFELSTAPLQRPSMAQGEWRGGYPCARQQWQSSLLSD